MAAKHIRVLMPSNTWTDHQVEELGAAVVAGLPGSKNYAIGDNQQKDRKNCGHM